MAGLRLKENSAWPWQMWFRLFEGRGGLEDEWFQKKGKSVRERLSGLFFSEPPCCRVLYPFCYPVHEFCGGGFEREM